MNIVKAIEEIRLSVKSTEITTTKEVMTLDEAAKFLGLSKSTLYKLTSGKLIPHYKPNGKRIYFKREELQAWQTQNRVSTSEELQAKAQSYCMKKGGI